MAECNANVWAPWRAEYIRALNKAEEMGCFLCEYSGQHGCDAQNHVVARTPHALVVLNRYPYTNGHVLIAPLRHVGQLEDLADEELVAVSLMTRDALRMLKVEVSAQGYNVGMNLGRCAGAGLPGHLHWHIVPRWNGDTNFMSTVGDSRVIPESLDDVYRRLCGAAKDLGLP